MDKSVPGFGYGENGEEIFVAPKRKEEASPKRASGPFWDIRGSFLRPR